MPNNLKNIFFADECSLWVALSGTSEMQLPLDQNSKQKLSLGGLCSHKISKGRPTLLSELFWFMGFGIYHMLLKVYGIIGVATRNIVNLFNWAGS